MNASLKHNRRTVEYPDPNSIKQTLDSETGNAIAYECDYLLSYNNTFPSEVVPAFYNLLYPCDNTEDSDTVSSAANDAAIGKAKALVENELFQAAALTWKIHPDTSGVGCSDPSLEAFHTLLVAVSALPPDQIVRNMDCLPKSKTAMKSLNDGVARCCVVIKSDMTFTPSGGYSQLDLIRFVAEELNSNRLTEGTPYQTLYAGSFTAPSGGSVGPDTIDTSQNRTSPPKGTDGEVAAVMREGEAQNSNRGTGLTPIGGVVLAGLTLAFVGLVFVVVRRRRRHRCRLDGIEYHDDDDDDLGTKPDSAGDNPYSSQIGASVNHNPNDSSIATNDDDGHVQHDGEAFGITVLSDNPKTAEPYTATPSSARIGRLGLSQKEVSSGGKFDFSPSPTPPMVVATKIHQSLRSNSLSPTRSHDFSVDYPHSGPRSAMDEPCGSFGSTTLSKSDSYDGCDSLDSSCFTDENVHSGDARNIDKRYRNKGYAFDLGHTFKNEIMRKHNNHNSNNSRHQHQHYPLGGAPIGSRSRSYSNGSGTGYHNSHNAPTTIEVVPPYPMMEETSDSEVDSWAQTDGTVGSLEERLEDITVEI